MTRNFISTLDYSGKSDPSITSEVHTNVH